MHTSFKIQYLPEIEQWIAPRYNTNEITALFSSVESSKDKSIKEVKTDTIPEIRIADLDAKKHEDFYENGNLKLFVELKNGKKHGEFRAYYENEELKIKGEFKNDIPSGKWKYYNEEGQLIKTDKY